LANVKKNSPQQATCSENNKPPESRNLSYLDYHVWGGGDVEVLSEVLA